MTARALQARLAEFMGTEESIIYSYDLATIPSVLPAFANAKDLIVCDEVSGAARHCSQPLCCCSCERCCSCGLMCLLRSLMSLGRA